MNLKPPLLRLKKAQFPPEISEEAITSEEKGVDVKVEQEKI